MELLVVAQKSLKIMLGLKRTLILVIIGLSVSMVVSYFTHRGFSSSLGSSTLAAQIQEVVDVASIVWYIWGAGLVLAMTSVALGAGFFSREASDGTLALLFSRPVSRYRIVLGKLLALLAYSVLMVSIIYLLHITLIWLVLRIDMDVLRALFALMPWILLYTLIVAFLFGSIASLLSALLTSRVKIMVLLMLVVILMFVGGILFRGLLFRDPYSGGNLYRYNPGYHMVNTYNLVLNGATHWRISPDKRFIASIFTGAPFSGDAYSSEHDSILGYITFERFDTGAAAVSLALVLSISFAAAGLAAYMIQRKQLY